LYQKGADFRATPLLKAPSQCARLWCKSTRIWVLQELCTLASEREREREKKRDREIERDLIVETGCKGAWHWHKVCFRAFLVMLVV